MVFETMNNLGHTRVETLHQELGAVFQQWDLVPQLVEEPQAA